MDRKKLRAVITTWHTPHQYDLMMALKDDVEFGVIENTNKKWLGRPFPDNAEMVTHYEPGKYDFAILNLDQQCIDENLYKSQIYPQLNSIITDIPKIVIQHGSPVWPEKYAKNGITKDSAELLIKQEIKKLIGDNPMVVNSHRAATDKEWGFGRPIIHGMDTEYWRPADWKESKVITALSPAGCDEYYNRAMMTEISNMLKRKYGYVLQWARISKEARFNEYELDKYRDWLGTALIYVDVSYRTPMNRARTEAMLSGCCVVQVKGAHDLDKFFKDGENIVLIPNEKPKLMADTIYELLEDDRSKALEIGRNARENAVKHFNHKNLRDQWVELLKELKIWK